MTARKTALVPLAPGFEEIEAITIVDLLRRAGVEVTTAGVGAWPVVEGAHKIGVRVDTSIDSAGDRSFSAVVLPGGMPGTTNLSKNRDLEAILRRHGGAPDSILAAICAAPTVLAGAGILEGKNATCYPGFEDQLAGARVRNEAVVEDGNVVTSRGPGTAIPFALRLIEKLCGRDKAEEIRKQTISS